MERAHSVSILSSVWFVIVFSSLLAAQAQMPMLLDYQGVLTDAGGSAVPDGDYELTFSLYTTSYSGTPLWTETHSTVTVTKAIFNVTLGSITALDLSFDKQYYLGISVESEAELVPRIALTAAPYSFNARGVRGPTNVFPPDGNVGIGTDSSNHTLNAYTNDETGIMLEGYHPTWPGIGVKASDRAQSEWGRSIQLRCAGRLLPALQKRSAHTGCEHPS